MNSLADVRPRAKRLIDQSFHVGSKASFIASALLLAFHLLALSGAPARAEHWGSGFAGQAKSCASGAECAIWQNQAAYGPGGPYICYQLGGPSSDWVCDWHHNSYYPDMVYSGYSGLYCDGNEIKGAEGCAPPVGKQPPSPCNTAADPVEIMEGGLYEAVTDYSSGSANPLQFTRYYWSDRLMGQGAERLSRLGANWRSNFDINITFFGSATSPAHVYISTFNGLTIHFETGTDANNKTYYIERGYSERDNSQTSLPSPPHHQITYVNGIYTYVDENDTSYAFNTSYKLQTITYRDGYQQTLAWANGQNTGVTDNLGRSISFTYDANTGNMSALRTADGQVFKYQYVNTTPVPASQYGNPTITYGPNGNASFVLQSVTYPGSSSPKVTYQYDDSRFLRALTGIVDERGIQISKWTYGADMRVSQNTRAGSVGTYSFAYDTSNNMTTITNPLGRKTVYKYGSNVAPLQLSQVQGVTSANCAASNTAYAYDANYNLSQVTDSEGRVTAIVNDNSGRPTSVTRGSGTAQATTTLTTWHPTLNVPTKVVQPNLTTDYTWNALGQLTQAKQTDTTTQTAPFSTAGRTRSWAYTYGIGGLLASVDGSLTGTGDTSTYTYNNQGFLKTTTDEVGHVTTVTAWNGRGQPTSATGINNVVTAYGYDDLGRMTSITVNPGSSQMQWSFAYTLAGDLATVKQPSGGTYTMTWDGARRLTTVANNLGETVNYTRDAMGDATGRTITAADGKTTTFQVTNTFDELGRLIKQVGGANAAWSYAYDRTDLQTGITDPRNKSLAYGYDAVSRLITETERDGGVVAHAYNGKSEETSYKDPRSLATTYVRDGFGDVIQETSPDRGVTVYDYDARGLVISRKDARGKQTTYAYDNAGRLTSVTYPATPALNVTYTYDGSAAGPNGIGHVTHVVDAVGTTDYGYDAVGRVTRETRTIGGVSSAVTYGWDPGGSGKLATMTLPSGIMITYSYDALGRPTLLSGSLGTVISSTPLVGNIAYFPFGGVQQIGYSNGVARFESDDLQYRINGLFLTQGAKVLMQRSFSFDDNLNLTQINNNATDSKQSQSLNYDAAQRLTYAAGAYGSRFWQYDTVGNRLSEAKTPAGSSTATTATYTYPATSNLLLSVMQGSTTTRAFTYDAAGNTAQDTRGTTAYNYTINDAGRIAQLTIGTTVTANYTYDAKDRLSVRQTLNMSPAGTTRFIYDIWDHLLAETTATGQPVRDYVWLGDEPVAVADWTMTAGSPTLFFVHTDHLHRPELMTDTSGKVVWQASYEPFGTVSSVTGTLTENQRFPGQWFQLETGLAYNWHRHYDPTIGRYTSPDPLGLFLSPQPSAPQTVAGGSVESGSGHMLAGTTDAPTTTAVDPATYPSMASSLSDVQQSPLGLEMQAPKASATTVLRDGPSLFGYIRQNPLVGTDRTGLVGPFTPIPWKNPYTKQCNSPPQVCIHSNTISDGLGYICIYDCVDGTTRKKNVGPDQECDLHYWDNFD